MNNSPYDLARLFIYAYLIAVLLTLVALGITAAWLWPGWTPLEVVK